MRLRNRRWSENWQAAAVMATLWAWLHSLAPPNRHWDWPLRDQESRSWCRGCWSGSGTVAALWRLKASFTWLLAVLGAFIILMFVVIRRRRCIKESLSSCSQRVLQAGRAAFLSPGLGFSYVAFRLLHTIRDRQTGDLPRST